MSRGRTPAFTAGIAGLLMLCGAMTTTAQALPADRMQSYSMHETPGDGDSPVIWSVELYLTAVNKSGSEVAWSIYDVIVRHFDGTGENDSTWELASPSVETGDGLWWVSHSDTEHPQDKDFWQPPLISDTLASTEETGSDLNVDFQGDEYSMPEDPPYSGNVAAVSYQLAYADNPLEPLADDSDEPVDTKPRT